MSALKIATAQSAISSNVSDNGRHVRDLMRRARRAGARLIHFPEGALSGYIKTQVKDWTGVDWAVLATELDATARLAAELSLWVAIGTNHRLEAPRRPNNSVVIISDSGAIVARYSKRFCSNTEIGAWYTPGREPAVFDVDGVKFGCAICIENCFPEVFAEYERLGVHCVLLSAYHDDPIYQVMAQAHAATNCYWLSLAVPSACSRTLRSALVTPDGHLAAKARPGRAGLVLGDIDPAAPQFEIPLRRARPWRAVARDGAIYADETSDG